MESMFFVRWVSLGCAESRRLGGQVGGQHQIAKIEL
jgi:hypothetical protein